MEKMSSSYIVEPQESSEKKDDTLIIVVNDDGTISVDQETLENMIMNQSTANVSVVRVGQSDTDAENGDLTLTVDPPSFTHPPVSTVNTSASTDPGGLVDSFMEMDQEQLERLETALLSEQAKQILGENVTAMLDMLSIEEQQNTMRYNIQLDHCYTSRLSPNDPVPRDPLPITDDSSESNDVQYMQTISSRTTVSTSSVDADTTGIKNKNIVKNMPLQSKQMNRPIRKSSTPTSITGLPRANTNIVGTPKLVGHPVHPRNITNVQQGIKAQGKNNEEEKDDKGTESSATSSESEPPSDNDNDSDFGPRSVKRGAVRSRGGGRKGLTTRGGSMAAVRRRGQNKHLDVEQVRRLDMEMAAAVNAMKTGEKDDRAERFNPAKSRRQIKTIGGKKKEEFPEMSSSVSEETPTTFEKPLQTTNQVKANLINANMIKGDMILTKPGQGRNNQKVTFVQKQVTMKPGEFKFGFEKSAAISKEKIPVTQRFFATKDGKLVPVPMISKSTSSNVQGFPVKTVISQTANQGLSLQQQSKTALLTSAQLKIKVGDLKKEKRKADALDSVSKIEESPTKSTENKALDSAKRPKKDNRKVPGYVTDTLGPALFSTPDIIRRVGSNSDGKATDNTTPLTVSTPSTSAPSSTIPNSTVVSLNLDTLDTPDSSHTLQSVPTFSNKKSVSDTLVQPEPQLSFHGDNNVGSENEQKSESKAPLTEQLHPPLDTGGIEGEEQLFATLEMEASKHEEELLAEALLLQEELDVDLAEHSALVDPTPTLSEPLASSNILMPTLISSELSKSTELPSMAQAQTNIPKEISKKSKDDKEPIQIIRGNRVITLPPIEAPATRSKRLQAKTEASQKNFEPIKKIEKFTPPTQQPSHNREELRTVANEEEDDDEEDEENSDSEDDPDRLWCICKRPHNNRFMICCDVCEDWFHGKCVNVTKAMGQDMEEKGTEWVCPNCLKKKAEEEKTKPNLQSLSGKQKTKPKPTNENVISQVISPSKEISSSSADHSAVPVSGTMQCVVCKKEARNSSIYCSDACILAHAQETQALKDKPVPTGFNTKLNKPPATEAVKPKVDPRVVVIDKKTNKMLTGTEAPLRSNLRTWLKENPSYKVLQAQDVNTLQLAGKIVTQTQTSEKIGAKITQVSPIKVQTVPKMIYTKVPGMKQTILTTSSKMPPTTLQQLSMQSLSKPVQLKQTALPTIPGKIPLILKTTRTVATPIHVKVQASSSPKQTPPLRKIESKPSPSPSPSQPKQVKVMLLTKRTETTEPIRESVRKTLTDVLSSRIKETEDLQLTDEEIAELACNIELEMYKYFKDTGSKYKAKYRSLIFNIKDTKNLTLFRKIADRSLTPHTVVRLNADKMASQELAEWREKEAKHQLEIIKKNELDLMAQAKSIVVKTHKGEQIIENDGGIDHVDPKTPVQDIVNALNSGDSISSTVDDMEKEKSKEERQKSRSDTKKAKSTDERRKKDKERGRERDSSKSRSKDRQERSHSRHRHRDRDRDHSKTRDKSKERKSSRKESRRDKEREREKDRERTKDRDRASRSEKEKNRKKEKDRHKSNDSHLRNRSESRESKDVDKKEDERKREMEKKKETSPQPTEKPIEDRLWRHIEDETTTNTIDGNDSDISDREPSSTVTIKTPDINEEPERDKEPETNKETPGKTVWRGFVNMVDVAKFFITAQEISGNAKDLMDDLPDTVDVVGRISHQTVWDYISKMKKSGSKEILVIRLTAANDEEKIPYITLYSYLNSRSRLGVVGTVSKTVKDFYIMPFSSQSTIPPVLLPLTGTGFEEHRPHLLLGIIVRNKKKRLMAIPSSVMPSKASKKESDRSYTPPLIGVPKEKTSSPPPSSSSPVMYKTTILDSTKEKPVTQMTLESLNKAYIGMSRNVIDSATICKIVPELSSKIDLTSSPDKVGLDDDGDEPYSPGEMDEDMNSLQAGDSAIGKNSTELQKKMEELNRQIEEQKQQIEEQKQQIQSISSSFLDDEATPTLPGLGLDPPDNNSDEEAYSPTNARSFTPPPPSISKFAQPILDKVSDITIPPNLQEILANVKRQESSKVDPYLPSKPSATFLPTAGTSLYQNTESYLPSSSKVTLSEEPKETKSTLSTLSDLDLIRKAEEELAAVAAATAASTTPPPLQPLPPSSTPSSLLQSPVGLIDTSVPPPQVPLSTESAKEVSIPYKMDSFKKNVTPEQPKPPGLEDEDFPTFPPTLSTTSPTLATHSKITPKSGNIVLNVKRKLNDDGTPTSPSKLSRTKSRWGQGPPE